MQIEARKHNKVTVQSIDYSNFPNSTRFFIQNDHIPLKKPGSHSTHIDNSHLYNFPVIVATTERVEEAIKVTTHDLKGGLESPEGF